MQNFDLATIDSMDGFVFEDLISQLLSKMKFTVEQTKQTGDGGIDINAYCSEPIVAGRYIVQCKRNGSPISESIIRDLYGVITSERVNKGILITNSTFSPAAVNFAQGKPIELIDGNKLINLLIKYFNTNLPEQSQERKIGIVDRLLFGNLIKVISKIKDDYKAVKSGLVFKKKKHIDDYDEYGKFLAEHNNTIVLFIQTIENFMKNFDGMRNVGEDAEIISLIKKDVNRFNEFLIDFYNNWQEFHFSTCPDGLIRVHGAQEAVYDALFASLFSWLSSIENLLNNPKQHATDDGRIDLVFDFNPVNQQIVILQEEVNKVNNI